MKIAVIKDIAEKYSLVELRAAEECILEEQTPEIEIDGDDEGEQLTHVLAAIHIKEIMEKESLTLPLAVRHYSQRVRKSIS